MPWPFTIPEIDAPDNDFRHPRISHTPLGALINDEISKLDSIYPEIKIYESVIMPDHVHLLIYISVEDVYLLGNIVAALKANCSKAWRASRGIPEAQRAEPVFDAGFHDRICRDAGHFDTIKKYISDNPRRLLMKRLYPEYYRQRRRISIDGRIYEMLGNPFLILNPFICQAHYSSRVSPDENRANYDRCLANIERGGVTIGTFFAHTEKDLRDRAIAAGGSIILMYGNGFDDRYAPPQPYFDLCREGRCLIIGEETYRASAASDIRDHNRALNLLAARLASALLRKPS